MSDLSRVLWTRPAVFEGGAYLPATLDPDAVKREYLRAAGADGTIDWNAVLDLASDPASALHDAIDWDDETAAAKQRRGVIVAIAWALRDKATGERVFESVHYQTRNHDDVGKLRINVRLLPAPITPRSPEHPTSFAIRTTPMPSEQPVLIDMPPAVVDRTPEEDRSLDVFRRWVEAHRHEPMVLRAALRILRETI